MKDTEGNAIEFFNVLIRNDDIHHPTTEFSISRDGAYLIQLTQRYNKIVIEVKAHNHASNFFMISSPKADSVYIIDFILEKIKHLNLEEVVVTADKLPFKVNGDTVIYEVSSYREKSDKKVEDIIKKLPGITLNEKTGEIKYKGRSIRKLPLSSYTQM